MKVYDHRARVLGWCLAVVLAGQTYVRADDGSGNAALQQKIDQLEKRIAQLEGQGTQVVMQASIPTKTLDFLGQTGISGFVSASYLYNFSKPTASIVAGRGFDVNNNSFTINKFKLTLEKPVNQVPDKWDAGYRADLIVGQDAPLTHSTGLFGGPNSGQSIDLEQAFVAFNVPIGNGLKVIFGKTVTLMGVEVIEEVANPNWSVGNQFLYVENFTQTGLQLAYKWSDKIDTEFVVFNGWDVLTDNNRDKSFMGRVGITPDDKTVVGLIGYGGPEQTPPPGGTGSTSNWRTGVNVVLNRKLTDKLNSWLQLDYGHEDGVDVNGGAGEWYAGGLWLTYDFTDKVGVALRGDYLRDKDGVRTPVAAAPLATPATFTTAPRELYSATLTLNIKAVANLQIRPEVRWDHSSANTALNGHDDQFTAGVGVAYLY